VRQLVTYQESLHDARSTKRYIGK